LVFISDNKQKMSHIIPIPLLLTVISITKWTKLRRRHRRLGAHAIHRDFIDYLNSKYIQNILLVQLIDNLTRNIKKKKYSLGNVKNNINLGKKIKINKFILLTGSNK